MITICHDTKHNICQLELIRREYKLNDYTLNSEEKLKLDFKKIWYEICKYFPKL